MIPRVEPAMRRALEAEPLTIAELAERVHATRRSVARLMRNWRKTGRVEPTGETRRTGERGRESHVYRLAA